jgi:uncharacterized membrane protein YgaE (UPF0421/DUF939 family)
VNRDINFAREKDYKWERRQQVFEKSKMIMEAIRILDTIKPS